MRTQVKYNEEYVGTARSVVGLLTLLKKLPNGATIEISNIEHYMDTEVWYDEGTNTVIFK